MNKTNFTFSFFCAALLATGVQAQSRVQGVPRSDLKNGTVRCDAPRYNTDFTFDDIEMWVGEGANKAALCIEWHDGVSPDCLVWGFRWDGTATGHDMIVAISRVDPRLMLLTQNTNLGYTIAGIGYTDDAAHMELVYDLDGARTDDRVSFGFDTPTSVLGQTHVPEHPEEEIEQAIRDGLENGVVYHPFNYDNYGYACYDYDHWSCGNALHWRSGWYLGYWSYFVKESTEGTFSYSGLGASNRQLVNGSWDAWSYCGDMSGMTGASPSGNYLAASAVESRPIGVEGLVFPKDKLRVEKGMKIDFDYVVRPSYATEKAVDVVSSDESVAKWQDGMLTAVSIGEASLTARDANSGAEAVCRVTVLEHLVRVSGVKLDQERLDLAVGETWVLEADVLPENADNKTVLWTSGDEAVAMVDATGKVTALSEGEVEIAVKTEDGDFEDRCVVRVAKPAVPVTGISLSRSALSMRIDQSVTLAATVMPADATNKKVHWKSSNETVASVDGEGMVSGLAYGKATITAQTEDGSFTAQCVVDVDYRIGVDKTSRSQSFYVTDGNQLVIEDYRGWSFCVYNADGCLLDSFVAPTGRFVRELLFPKGIYLLRGSNGTEAVAETIAVGLCGQ